MNQYKAECYAHAMENRETMEHYLLLDFTLKTWLNDLLKQLTNMKSTWIHKPMQIVKPYRGDLSSDEDDYEDWD